MKQTCWVDRRHIPQFSVYGHFGAVSRHGDSEGFIEASGQERSVELLSRSLFHLVPAGLKGNKIYVVWHPEVTKGKQRKTKKLFFKIVLTMASVI